jgi:uncharacterized protein
MAKVEGSGHGRLSGYGKRLTQLMVGLLGFGVAVPLMIRSGLGLGPWDAFHLGIHRLTGMSVGTASILVGLVIIVGTLKLGVRPGIGTVANMLVIGIVIDLILPLLPHARGWPMGFGYFTFGVLLAGFATGMYMGAGLGNGPRDGMILGISLARGWPFRRVRTIVEMTVLTVGWAMGGTVGVGTLLFALTIGPVTQRSLQLFGAIPATAVPATVVPHRPWKGWKRNRRLA